LYASTDYLGKTTITGRVFNPVGVGSITDGANGSDRLEGAYSIAIAGNYAYVTGNNDNGVQILDISDPTNPVGIGSIAGGENGADTMGAARSITITGNYAYVTNFDGVQVLDISDPANPSGIGSIKDGENGADGLYFARSIAISGNYAYVASVFFRGVQVLDISDPTNPIGISSITDGANGADELDGASSIIISGNYAYVASISDDGVQILDISDPTNLVGVGSVTDGASGANELDGATSIAISGNYIYIASEFDDGVQILDISDPTNPVGVGSITDGASGANELNGASGITVSGNYAYVTGSVDNGVQILDISDPTNPIGVGSITDGANGADTLAGARGIAISGNYAYVASSNDDGVQILDIGALETANLYAGNIRVDLLQVDQTAIFDAGINVRGSANIGGDSLIGGALAVTKFATTSLTGIAALTANLIDNNVASIADVLKLNHAASGTIASGIGTGILFASDNAGTGTSTSRIASILTDVSTTSPRSALTFSNKNTVGSLTEFMRLTADGYLGIGTTTPSASIATNGAIFVGATNATSTFMNGIAIRGGCLSINGSCLSTETAGFVSAAGMSVLSNITDNVGIGTTSASAKLTIQGDAGDITNSFTIASSSGRTLLSVSSRGAVEIRPGELRGVGSITDGASGANELDGANSIAISGNYAYVTSGDDDGVQILDISDPTNPVGIGSISDGDNGADTLYGASNITISGNYAYVTSQDFSGSNDGVQILDISNPTNPIGVGSITDGVNGADELDGASSITISGNYAYVASQSDNGVQVLDISDPTNPIGVGSIEYLKNGADFLYAPTDIVVRGNYAYVTNYSPANAVEIIDVSNPANMFSVGSITDGLNGANTLNGARSIAIAGNYAYVTGELDNGVQILDISDPTNPVGVGSITNGANGADQLDGASSIAIAGNYAYVSSRGFFGTVSGVQILDISDPTNPIGVGSIQDETNGADTLNGATSIAIAGNYAYVASRIDDGVQILDLGGFTTPTTEIGSLLANKIETNQLYTDTSYIYSSLNVGTNALIGGALTITGTASSSLQGSNTNTALSILSGNVAIGSAQAATATDKLSITGGSFSQAGSYSSTTLYTPTLVGTLGIGGSPVSFTVLGRYAYVVDATSDDLKVIDVSNPDTPTLVGTLGIGGNPYSVTVSGRYAYVVDGISSDLKIIDVSNPSTPTLVGTLGVGGFPLSVTVSGNYAYVVDVNSDDLKVIDVSNPATPTLIGALGIGGFPRSVTVSGRYAYVVDALSEDLKVIDVSNPNTPVLVGALGIGSDPFSVTVSGRYVYVVDTNSDDFKIIDISNPTTPTLTGVLGIGGSPLSVTVSGRYAYVIDSASDDLKIIDISNPATPMLTGTLGIGGDPRSVTISGRYAYVIDFTSDDLKIIDISGIEVQSAIVHSLEAGTFQTLQDATIGGQLSVVGGASIGSGGLRSDGAGSFTAFATTSLEGVSALSANIVDNNTASIADVLKLNHSASGTIANGIGTGILFASDNAGTGTSTSRIASILTDVSTTSPRSALTFSNKNTAGALTEFMRLTADGYLSLGTTTPGAKLTIQGTVGDTNNLITLANSDGDTLLSVSDVGAVELRPGQMRGVGSITNGTNGADELGDPKNITISGNYAYVTNSSFFFFNGGVQILDISDPTNPIGVGSITDGANGADELNGVWSIAISGNYAYVTGYGVDFSGSDGGVQILDVSDPTNPVGVGSITDGESGADDLAGAISIAVSGNYAYVASSIDDGVQILDISDPTNPIGVGSITDGANGADELEGAWAITIAGNYAYVASADDDGVQILDISDPTNPVGVGSITDEANGADELEGAYGITISGNYAYVASIADNGVQILDISDPINPIGVGSIRDGQNGADRLDRASSIAIAGNYAYVTGVGDNGVQILDISDPTNPVGIGSIRDGVNGADELRGANSIAITGNYAYVTGDENGVQVLSLGGLTTPTAEIGTLLSNKIDTETLNTNTANLRSSLNVGTNALIGGALTITGTASSTLLSSNNNTALAVLSGNVGIGTSSPNAKLTLRNTNFSGAGIIGINQYLQTENTIDGATQFGNRLEINASNTATTTLVGSVLTLKDNTTFGNTVRGLEVQANQGINTNGENTAISGFGRTFGVRGVTTGDAGSTFEPAGGFFQSEGTTQGNAIRGYSGNITTASLLALFQDTSAFTGTGLEMNFGNSSGSFASSSSKYLDFQNAGASVFTVTAFGTTTIGDGTTNNLAGLQIGFGGICVDNDGSCTASTSGRITSVESFTGNSDLAEIYFSDTDLAPGEVVVLRNELSVDRATKDSTTPILGVVSTKPGLTLGFDDTSLTEGETAFPIALSGRVPIKLSTENGPITRGDHLMLSSLPGIAMKATGTGATVGIALEDFDDKRKYSNTYLNQFGDDMTDPIFIPVKTNSDPRINDGCYFGGGTATGDAPCVPLIATSSAGQMTEVNDRLEAESTQEQLEDLAEEKSDTVNLPNGQTVQVGQIVMFVQNGHRWLDANMASALAGLTMVDTTELDGLLDEDTLLLNPLERVVGVLVRMFEMFTTTELSLDQLEAENNVLDAQLTELEAAGSAVDEESVEQPTVVIDEPEEESVIVIELPIDESATTTTPEIVEDEPVSTTTEPSVEEPVVPIEVEPEEIVIETETEENDGVPKVEAGEDSVSSPEPEEIVEETIIDPIE
jgi:hypothetical protein